MAVPFFTACLKQQPNGSTSLICDTLSICSHLVRMSPSHIDMLMQMFRGPKRDYELLGNMLCHSAAVVRSRTCSMLGNVLKHSGTFYAVLSKCDKLVTDLMVCLSDEDPDVRKGASYAVGNAAYHSGALYGKLQRAIPSLISLLDDPVAKTRANAVGALGNLAIHSDQLCGSLLSAKAIHSMLEVACHDTQYGVQECALMALRSMCSQASLKKELLKLKAVDKLSRVSDSRVRSSQPTSPVSSTALSRQLRPSLSLSKSMGRHSITNVMQHCYRLIKILNL
ncbi:hypothetical protein LSAT2_022553 [Lamellibrachia satsuma]|nr:hypothetical protein LSAT2_022553 [Lamellibrachia satsuma]